MQVAFPAAFAPFAAFFRSPAQPVVAPRAMPATAPVRMLKAGTMLAVPQPRGQRIECLRGSLWLTHDGDPKDIVLAAGDSYTVDRDARLLVYGLDASELRIA
jgi:hypothetical protein